jgi:hypothetical protein
MARRREPGSQRTRRRVAVAVLGAVALLAAPSDAAIRGESGFVAFDSNRLGGRDVFVLGPGGIPQSIAANSAAAIDRKPAWTPRLDATLGVQLETRQTDTFELTIDGFGGPARRVLVGEESVDFSASGLEIRADLPAGLTQSTDVCVVPDSAFASDFHLQWTTTLKGALFQPGATEFRRSVACTQPLAFESDRTGDTDIWIWNPALPLAPAGGSEPPNPVNLTQRPGAADGAPSWSPRVGGGVGSGIWPRSLLAFESNRDGDREIYVVDPLEPLSDSGPQPNPVKLTNNAADDSNPDWSPDGTQITWDSDEGGERRIWVMDIGTNPVGSVIAQRSAPITIDQAASFDPSWFEFNATGTDPDDPELVQSEAHHIVFAGPTEHGDIDLHYVEHLPEGGVPFADVASLSTFTLGIHPDTDLEPAWSPTGGAIAFASDSAGSFDIWTANSDGGDAAQVTSDQGLAQPGDDRNPAWQSVELNADIAPRRPRGRARRRVVASSAGLAPTTQPATDTPVETSTLTPPATRCTQTGTSGRDVLRGTAGRDVLCGRGGDDVLAGAAGNDRLIGGAGRDRLAGGPGRDALRGGRHADTLNGGRGGDDLFGDAGNDRLAGGPGRDVLKGGSGRDRLFGEDGQRDVVDGGKGRDVATVDPALDRLRLVERVR